MHTHTHAIGFRILPASLLRNFFRYFLSLSVSKWEKLLEKKNLVHTISSVMQSHLFDFCSHKYVFPPLPDWLTDLLVYLLHQVRNFKCVIQFACAHTSNYYLYFDVFLFAFQHFNCKTLSSANKSQTSSFFFHLHKIWLHCTYWNFNIHTTCKVDSSQFAGCFIVRISFHYFSSGKSIPQILCNNRIASVDIWNSSFWYRCLNWKIESGTGTKNWISSKSWYSVNQKALPVDSFNISNRTVIT